MHLFFESKKAMFRIVVTVVVRNMLWSQLVITHTFSCIVGEYYTFSQSFCKKGNNVRNNCEIIALKTAVEWMNCNMSTEKENKKCWKKLLIWGRGSNSLGGDNTRSKPALLEIDCAWDIMPDWSGAKPPHYIFFGDFPKSLIALAKCCQLSHVASLHI